MIKLYAIKHNTEDLYYSDIAVGFVSLSPLELFTEQHYQRVLDGMWPEDRAVSHIVVFDLTPSPPESIIAPDGSTKKSSYEVEKRGKNNRLPLCYAVNLV